MSLENAPSLPIITPDSLEKAVPLFVFFLHACAHCAHCAVWAMFGTFLSCMCSRFFSRCDGSVHQQAKVNLWMSGMGQVGLRLRRPGLKRTCRPQREAVISGRA